MCEFYENYQMLAEAIIMQAVRDYRKCSNRQSLDFIEDFFASDWFATLCKLDGKTLIKRLKNERMMNNG